MSEMPDDWCVDANGEKVVVNFPVEGDYGHRVLSRHQARVLRTQLRRLWRRRRECAQHSAICSQATEWLDEDHHGGRPTAPVVVRRRHNWSLSSAAAAPRGGCACWRGVPRRCMAAINRRWLTAVIHDPPPALSSSGLHGPARNFRMKPEVASASVGGLDRSSSGPSSRTPSRHLDGRPAVRTLDHLRLASTGGR
jgi:hypothetical protein